ncbi:MAG: NYN domain-containing protein [Pegethrix bostrychoides GSE-TBD4-15B]|jgi:hypothetical protein|uniref:NYN domain-containing protein n=1 Tax=Pegethrix bostrychoides GSE-TBD4-15B TaxID=2839662 RepID=A0A951P7R7_9CYAN|nr:NYN domain-containing protein [Pegethrix bostrychoides GSE-TBD4-15B]
MADFAATPRLAILFDAENVSAAIAGPMLSRLQLSRFVTIKRAYADWSRLQNGWKSVLVNYGIHAVHTPNYSAGKNSADILLTIDAMDLLHQQVSWFCIVTNDGDFTPLVHRLIGGGARVVGFGSRRAALSFISACHKYIVLEETEYTSKAAQKAALMANLQRKQSMEVLETPEQSAARARLAVMLHEIFSEASPQNHWVNLKDFHARIQRRQPDFSCRQFGQKGMVKLMESLNLFELRKVKNPTAPSQVKHELRLRLPDE